MTLYYSQTEEKCSGTITQKMNKAENKINYRMFKVEFLARSSIITMKVKKRHMYLQRLNICRGSEILKSILVEYSVEEIVLAEV